MNTPARNSNKALRFRDELSLRRRQVLRHRNTWISAGVAAAYVILSSIRSPLAPKDRSTVADLSNGTFALAGFGFSVALAAVAIVVALPSSRLLRNMLNPTAPESGRSPYSDLVFLFTWTGIVQGVAAGMGMFALVLGGQSVLLTVDDPVGLVLGAAVIASSTYALLQLMTAAVTISQIASLQARYNFVDGATQGGGHPQAYGDEA